LSFGAGASLVGVCIGYYYRSYAVGTYLARVRRPPAWPESARRVPSGCLAL